MMPPRLPLPLLTEVLEPGLPTHAIPVLPVAGAATPAVSPEAMGTAGVDLDALADRLTDALRPQLRDWLQQALRDDPALRDRR